ncbi:hypothetical protein [Rubritalea tangerina]|uniref:hypothetical protein n=1 Tax=Rubritalea tangerina TaxID=430798 RepID=UPI00360C2948
MLRNTYRGLFIVFAIIAAIIGTCSFYIHNYKEDANKDACIVVMGSINTAILSQGIYTNTDEIWADPQLTWEYLYKDHPDFMKVRCPSGGTYTLEYREDSSWPNIPVCVCSLESSKQHNSPYKTQ